MSRLCPLTPSQQKAGVDGSTSFPSSNREEKLRRTPSPPLPARGRGRASEPPSPRWPLALSPPPSSLPCPTRGRGRVGSPREGKSGQPGLPPCVSRLAPPLKGRASRNRLAPLSPCPAQPAGRAGRRPPAAHPLPAGRVPSPHRPVALAVALPCPRKRKSKQTARRPDERPPSPHCHGSPRDQFSPVCVILLAMSKGCSFSKSILRSWGGDRAKNNHKEEEESLTGLHRPFRPSRFKMENVVKKKLTSEVAAAASRDGELNSEVAAAASRDGNSTLIPTSKILHFTSKLLSDSQIKLYRNNLKMPQLMLEEREKKYGRFIANNGLIEDPCSFGEACLVENC
ncbi:hypothetical protein Taro_023773 [Colocasia esculenta]|uniref:Uncharacterized protein n=1 Tax=Colocasia esculenta TaxID=4460 RepID=A0A843V9B8_COLES|nr:hypothetical protein [Colocasia esculenta]